VKKEEVDVTIAPQLPHARTALAPAPAAPVPAHVSAAPTGAPAALTLRAGLSTPRHVPLLSSPRRCLRSRVVVAFPPLPASMPLPYQRWSPRVRTRAAQPVPLPAQHDALAVSAISSHPAPHAWPHAALTRAQAAHLSASPPFDAWSSGAPLPPRPCAGRPRADTGAVSETTTALAAGSEAGNLSLASGPPSSPSLALLTSTTYLILPAGSK
jgi:hypothetical protein